MIKDTYLQAVKLHNSGQIPQAVNLYQQILAVAPNHVDSLHMMGVALHQNGQHQQAIACIGKAIEIGPAQSEYHCNLGSCFMHLGKLSNAIDQYKISLNLNHKNANASQNMGVALHELGRYNDEIIAYENGLQHNPNSLQLLNELVKTKKDACHWDGLDAQNTELKAKIKKEIRKNKATSVTAFHALSVFNNFQEQLFFSTAYAKGRFDGLKSLRKQLNFKFDKKSDDIIKIGYVCADFGNHPTGHLMRTMFEHHNRDKFEIYAYSIGRDDKSHYRQHIEENADHFVNLSDMSLVDKVGRINGDKIDILIDVMGYIKNSQTEIFALKPAPIQVSFLAYPATMGAKFIDYIVTDQEVVGQKEIQNFTEKPIFMPHSYFITDDRQEISTRTYSREECGLPADKFIFACFNKPYKITGQMFDVWQKILQQVPNSALWLFADNPDCKDNLQHEADKMGFGERVVFANHLSKAQHLSRHKNADLFLDCFNINAHTTAIDALWAGLPVLTKRGGTIISRASASIAKAANMESWVVNNADEYIKKAVYYANNPRELAQEKHKLADRHYDNLFKTAQYVKYLEDGLIQAYEYWQAGQKPQVIYVQERVEDV